jgi:hypothetical protein
VTRVLIRGGDEDSQTQGIDVHGEKLTRIYSKKAALCKSRTQSSGGTRAIDP